MDQTDASLNSVLSAIRALLIAFGGWLASNGYSGTGLYKNVELGAGAVFVIGPALWGVYSAIQNFRQKKAIRTQAVNAGMAFATSEKMAITPDGNPVPASDAMAHEIVQTFAPTPAK